MLYLINICNIFAFHILVFRLSNLSGEVRLPSQNQIFIEAVFRFILFMVQGGTPPTFDFVSALDILVVGAPYVSHSVTPWACLKYSLAPEFCPWLFIYAVMLFGFITDKMYWNCFYTYKKICS